MKKIIRIFTLITALLAVINFSFETSGDYANAFPFAYEETQTGNSISFSQTDFSYENIQDIRLIPSGNTLGIKFFTSGVLVVGMTDINTANGKTNPSYDAGIRINDIITEIDGKPVNFIEEISEIMSNSNGTALSFKIKRGENEFDVNVSPTKDITDNAYKLGIWIRDSTAGIGTITYINPENNDFAALGHGISDIDTGSLLLLSDATVYESNILNVIPGKKGQPGELKGRFTDKSIGKLTKNTKVGIFGRLSEKASGDAIPIALKGEIVSGDAQIICTLDENGPKTYNVSVQKLLLSVNEDTKNMIVTITDKELLSITGGIVQGMSGSPIIQNGKLIGAITHVLVNDPTKGYGIYIENMLSQ